MKYLIEFYSPLKDEVISRRIEADNAETAQKAIQMYYRISERDILTITEED